MVESMISHSEAIGFGFQHIEITGTAKLMSLLDELAFHARKDSMKPLIHLDMHGNKDNGLYVIEEDRYISWSELAKKLRSINKYTANNLAVVGATCYGLHAIRSISLADATPFYLLLAPEHKVTLGYLEDNIPNFYRTLFESESIDIAYSRHISSKFKYFNCEKLLFITVARYISNHCKGRGGAARRERLLTEIFDQHFENSSENRKIIRKWLKDGLRPDQSLLDKYAEKFMVGRQCSFTCDDLLRFVEKNGAYSFG
jgi:hypothetical protein